MFRACRGFHGTGIKPAQADRRHALDGQARGPMLVDGVGFPGFGATEEEFWILG